MIFYLIPATADRPAMLAPKGDDARLEAKARGLKLKPADMLHDIPTDKAGLQLYINAMLVTQHNLHADVEATVDAPLMTVTSPASDRDATFEPDVPLASSFSDLAAVQRAEEKAKLMGVKRDVADIADQIMTMEGESLGQCALAVASRYQELAR